MPPTPFVPGLGIHQVEMRFTWNAQKVEMVFHTGAHDTDPSVEEAETFGNFWIDLKTVCSNTITLNDVRIIDLTTVDGPGALQPFNAPGDVNTASVNNTLAPCMTVNTAKRGKSFQGRKYVPGLAAGFQVVNTIDGTAVTALNSAFNDLRLALNLLGTPWVIFSKKSGGEWRTQGVATAVTSVALRDNVLDNQRRRKPGNGQ